MNKWKIFYFATFFVGIALMIFEISIYRKTVIPILVPILIILVCGIFATFFNTDHYLRIFDYKWKGWAIFQNTVSWGFMASYLFMAVNFYGAKKESQDQQFKIISKSSLAGSHGNNSKRSPTIRINYGGKQKELVFAHWQTEQVEAAEYVTLTIRRGLLGYDIFERIKLPD